MDSGDGRQRPRRIVVTGPLEGFADGLRRELAGQGHALDTVGDHVHLLADLSGWLGGQDLTAEDLTTQSWSPTTPLARLPDSGHRTQ